MKKNLRYFMTLLLMMVASVGWAEDAYTLTPAKGSNSNYASDCDITISGITWNVTGNAQLIPWRIGGKSLSGVDRTVYSKTAMGSAISKVELEVGAASSITVNSLKLTVASDDAFSDIIDEVSATFAANSTITFTPTSGTEWATGAYYKFTFNVTVNGTSNKFVEFSSAKFFKTSSGDTPSKTDIATLTSITPTTLRVGNTGDFTLNASFADGVTEGTDYSVNWASDNTTVLTLNGNAYEAKAVGTANVTVTVSVIDDETYNEVSKSFAVEVIAAANPDQIFYETFNKIEGTGGRDNVFSGNVGTLSTKDNTDETWTTLGDHGASHCIKLGTGKAAQSATTGEINLKGSGSLTFSAAGWSSDENKLTVTAEGGIITGDTDITLKNGEWSDYTVNIEGANGNLILTFTMKRGFLDDVKVMKVEAPTVATPTFSVLAGSYDEPQTVEITCETEGAKIYYTLDGTTPTEESTEYTSEITINNTTTLKAIAIKDGKSSYVASATYTLPTICANIDAMNALKDKTEFVFNGKVTVVYASGSYVYIKDDSGSSLLYKGGLGVEKGDVIKAGWKGKVSIYNNLFEVVPSTALVSEEKAEVTYPVATTAEVTKANMNKVVVLKGVTYGEIKDKNFKIGSDIAGFNQFGIDIPEAEEGATYDIEGVISVFKENVQFQPISITKVESSVETATITLNAACTDGKLVYGTYSNSSAFVVSDDIVVSEVGIVDGKLYVEAYKTGDIVPANTGVMVSAAEGGDYTVNLSSEAGTSVLGTDNCLKATGDGITAENMAAAYAADCKFYRLTMHNNTTLGFYWGANKGAAFALEANKAYLAVPASLIGAKEGFAFGETTGINNVNGNDNESGKIFNLAGQQMKSAVKGVYIKNGRKYVK